MEPMRLINRWWPPSGFTPHAVRTHILIRCVDLPPMGPEPSTVCGRADAGSQQAGRQAAIARAFLVRPCNGRCIYTRLAPCIPPPGRANSPAYLASSIYYAPTPRPLSGYAEVRVKTHPPTLSIIIPSKQHITHLATRRPPPIPPVQLLVAVE